MILRDLQDMDYKEIAQVLRIPKGRSSPASAVGAQSWRGCWNRTGAGGVEMTERNPFDHKPTSAGLGELRCEEWELLLAEGLDGALRRRTSGLPWT